MFVHCGCVRVVDPGPMSVFHAEIHLELFEIGKQDRHDEQGQQFDSHAANDRPRHRLGDIGTTPGRVNDRHQCDKRCEGRHQAGADSLHACFDGRIADSDNFSQQGVLVRPKNVLAVYGDCREE